MKMVTTAILFWCLGIVLGIQAERLWPSTKLKSSSGIEDVYFDSNSMDTVYYNTMDDPWHLHSKETGCVTVPYSGQYQIKNCDGITFEKNCDVGDKFLNPIFIKRLGPKK